MVTQIYFFSILPQFWSQIDSVMYAMFVLWSHVGVKNSCHFSMKGKKWKISISLLVLFRGFCCVRVSLRLFLFGTFHCFNFFRKLILFLLQAQTNGEKQHNSLASFRCFCWSCTRATFFNVVIRSYKSFLIEYNAI